MAKVLISLKEKFPDIYNFLLTNQKENNLIFFGPSPRIYAQDSLKDKSFYYNHIFQQSKFDPNLYTSFYGKVLKSTGDKTFVSYIGWSREMTIKVIEESYNEDGLFYYQTDGICIEVDLSKIAGKHTIELKKFNTSNEYLEYYSKFNTQEYKLFQKGISSIDSFIFYILNNYILIKGYEEQFSKVLNDKINKFISAFEIIFRTKSPIVIEFIDSYIFSQIYDKIMEKIDSFYTGEKSLLKEKIEENIGKYGILELKLDISLLKCDFSQTFEKMKNLKKYKNSFEKMKCLKEINDSMLSIAKNEFEKENDKLFDIQGDLIIECWTHILANYINKNDAELIYPEYLFFKYLKISKGREENDYISNSFICAMDIIQKELLNSTDRNKKPEITLIKVQSLD